MNPEKGPELLSSRAVVSMIKELDDLLAERGIEGKSEDETTSLDRHIRDLEDATRDAKMNYTDEQWNLLVQIANHESGYSASAESSMVGNQDEDYKKERQESIDANKRHLQKRWQDIFGDEPFDW